MEYHNEIGKTYFTNATLQKATEVITEAGKKIQNSGIAIAQALAVVDRESAWKDDGFDSICDYTKQVFNLGRSQCYNLVKIGRELVQPAICESVLKHDKGNDYSATQLGALLPLNDPVLAMSLADEEIITPYMSVAEIKKIVKQTLAAKEESEETFDESSNQLDEVNLVEATYQNAIAALTECLEYCNDNQADNIRTMQQALAIMAVEIIGNTNNT